MTLDQVLRRSQRTGFRIAACEPIATPIYKLRLRVLIEESKEIPVVHEYILRTVDSGLTAKEEVSGFLGLDPKAIDNALIELWRDNYILVGGTDTSPTLRLTGNAIQALHESAIRSPREDLETISYDGLSHQISLWDQRPFHGEIPLRQVREQAITDLPSHPQRPPESSDLPPDRIADIVNSRTYDRRRSFRFLDVLGIEGKRQIFYRTDAYAVVYVPITGGEAETEIYVGTGISRPHTDAYRRAQQLRRKGPLIPIELGIDPADLVEHVAPGTRDLLRTTQAPILDLQQKEAKLEEAAATLKQRIVALPPNAATEELEEQVTRLELEHAAIADELAAYPVRYLETREHRPLLVRTLSEASDRILIISPWIRASATDNELLSHIESALQRSVDIYIGYGIAAGEHDRSSAVRNLTKLATKYNSLHLAEIGNTHAKVLAADNDYAATGSFNWLSFKGDPKPTYRDERSVLVAARPFTDEVFGQYLHQFGHGPKPERTRQSITEFLQGAAQLPNHAAAPDPTTLISNGESQNLEFKETARVNTHTDKRDPAMEDAVVKTIAAFLNTDGGTLFIGVADDGTVRGLDRDIRATRDNGVDGLELWLTDLLKTAIGIVNVDLCKVTFPTIDQGQICQIDVQPAPREVFARTSKSPGKKQDTFFKRTGNRTDQLSGQELLEYVRRHWPA